MLLGAAAAGEAGGAAIELFKQWAGKAADGVLNATLIDDLWATIQQRVSAHAMTNYQSLVAALSPKKEDKG
jgi:hypothetical protein